MQVTELESKGLKRQLKIVVEAAAINGQIDAELKNAGERVKIPGFRPGFIPMNVLKQRYGKAVQSDVIKQVIHKSTGDALTQKKFRPAMTPQINIENYSEGGELSFTLDFEIFPEVPEVKLEAIKLTRSVFEIGDKDIADGAGRIAERSPKFTLAKAGSAAKMGQVVVIDFKGMMDGVAFKGGSANDFRLELGSGQFIPGFEEQLVGAKKGDDKIVTVPFPKDYPSENLAGKEASFSVKIKDILDKETPAIDDAFAKEHGLADLAALNEAIRTQMTREYDFAVRNRLKKALFDALEEDCDFELPQIMVETEFGSIWSRLEEAKKAGDPSVAGKSDDELKEEYRAIAERRVKLGILLAELGNRHNVQVTREELGRAVMQQASQYPGQEHKILEFYKSHPERAEDLRGPILEEKVVDFILTKVAYDDKKVTLAELMEESEDEGAIQKKKSSEKKPAKAKAAKKKSSGE